MLKIVISPIALTLLLLGFSLESAAQCDCVHRDPSAVEEYDRATAVLIGEILTIQNGQPDHSYRYVQTVTVRVERAWKSDLPSTVTLRNEIHGCINGLKVGDRYLVYAHINKDEATYSNGCCCSRTKKLDRVDGDLEAFAKNGYPERKVIGLEYKPTTDEQRWTEVDLTVKGIRSGTPYSTIINKIGKPIREKSIGIDECGEGGRIKNLIYAGLTIGVLSDPRGHNYQAFSIEVTSAKWMVSPGILIGDNRDHVRSTFGQPVRPDDGDPTELRYVTKENTGNVVFEFEAGKLLRVFMQETLC